jgi:hypothetical protein
MLSTREILLEYVSPLLGAIFANLMFAGKCIIASHRNLMEFAATTKSNLALIVK